MAEPTSDHASPIGEITHGPSSFEQFLDRNQKAMIVLGLVLALGVGAWVVISGMEEGKRLAAGEALVGADDVSAMQDVVKNHPGTPAAASAAVLLSDMQWDEGQQSAAIETLRGEIEANPDHPATVPARARLATRLLQQGDRESASARFEEIVERPDSAYLAPYALLSLSEIAREEGRIEEAKELLERAAEDYPDNPLRWLVTQAISYVDFEMPEAVDPPAPIEEPADPSGDLAPEPDLSTPVELDPTSPGAGSGTGNPLLDNLTGGGEATDDSPAAPAGETPDPAPEPTPDPAPEPTPEDTEDSASGANE
ncbi:tetratricopeptide repeat protein [Haloferula sp. A504]|uniref:tetratricopeptide repeat protein n=1 Tax=Haloferula sp. A504 TaxID=3373601 RepID=UPI0031C292A5|nr:tetratricopeptide repeat protein [Verrucomicrobiaceae bacterium E54]